jgi:hypothetical protein
LLVLISALAWPQFMGPPRARLQFPTPASPDEAAITVAYKDMALADVLKDFDTQTGYLVTAAPDQVDQKITVSNTGKPFDILGRVCMRAQCAPRTAVYLVPEAKMPKAQPKFDLPQTTLTINAKDSDTKQVLDMIGKAAGLNLIADDDVLKANPGVTVSFTSATVEEVLDKLASQLKCHIARGIYLEHVDPGAEMDKFMALPPQQQEAMMVQGLDMMKDHMPGQQQVQQGMTDGLKDFWGMSAGEQGQIVQEVTKRMTQMGDVVSGFSPAGQAKVMSVIRPFLQAGIGVYLRLTPAQQATFAPAIKAMEHFPGGAPQ